MPAYNIRHLDAETIAAAKERAQAAGTSLDAVLRAYLIDYAAGHCQQQSAGRARAASMTRKQRSELAQRAAIARWSQT